MRLNQHAEIVREDFAEHFVDLRGWKLITYTRPKLGLDHMKGTLNVGAFVVVLAEQILVQTIELKRLVPDATAALSSRVALEVDVRCRAFVRDYSTIL